MNISIRRSYISSSDISLQKRSWEQKRQNKRRQESKGRKNGTERREGERIEFEGQLREENVGTFLSHDHHHRRSDVDVHSSFYRPHVPSAT